MGWVNERNGIREGQKEGMMGKVRRKCEEKDGRIGWEEGRSEKGWKKWREGREKRK